MTFWPRFSLRSLQTEQGEIPAIIRGPEQGAPLLCLPPLFEELNRTRHLLNLTCDHLALAGVTSWIIDLPGCGESDGEMNVAAWVAAVKNVMDQLEPGAIFAMRGGALLAPSQVQRIFFAPIRKGQTILRDLIRAQNITDRQNNVTRHYETCLTQEETVDLLGYRVTPELARDLAQLNLDGDDYQQITLDQHGREPPAPWLHAEPYAPIVAQTGMMLYQSILPLLK